MIDFINTIDTMSDEAAQDAILTDGLTELYEARRTKTIRTGGMQSVRTVSFPLVTNVVVASFQNWVSLVNVHLPAAKEINSEAFSNCRSLGTIHLPSATKFVYAYHFRNCTALTTVILSNRHVVASLGSTDAFEGTPIANGTGYVYVRKKLLEQYKSATNWSAIASQIRAIEDHQEIKAIVDADLAEMRGKAT